MVITMPTGKVGTTSFLNPVWQAAMSPVVSLSWTAFGLRAWVAVFHADVWHPQNAGGIPKFSTRSEYLSVTQDRRGGMDCPCVIGPRYSLSTSTLWPRLKLTQRHQCDRLAECGRSYHVVLRADLIGPPAASRSGSDYGPNQPLNTRSTSPGRSVGEEPL
jgi:hypothetical protein